ncbi:MAG: hypothetical protein LPJ89_05545, partial [Hymenobacteraceae bacterium]|nr:hypothetical protein [Hymenobacteraceae bacterium]MDX5394810.1 hypothetical protein [Hymenobacteraceae bacterium]MDX5443233.1 hypothetical protein [Hymenobacteraceae bacterium]MDX5510842.1 hypothetical protein [Hymenobacteraceae bacterium]
MRTFLPTTVTLLLSILLLSGCQKGLEIERPDICSLSKTYAGNKLTSEYIFNNDNQLERINYYNDQEQLAEHWLITRNSAGQVEKVDMIGKNNLVQQTFVYSYSGKGQLIQVSNYSKPASPEVMDSYTLYFYNNFGALEKSVIYTKQDNNFRESGFTTYSYNAGGDMTEQKTYSIQPNQEAVLSSVIQYEYDTRQNPLRNVDDGIPALHKTFFFRNPMDCRHNITNERIYDATGRLTSNKLAYYEYNTQGFPVKATFYNQ